jgi:hypothetical protein
MKKLYVIILPMLLIIGLFAGCKKSTYEISIKPDRTSYNAASSSVRGITVSPELKTNDKNLEVQYYWSTTEGEFIGKTGKETVNTGEPLIWNPISENSKSVPSTTIITLTAKEKKTDKILATTNLTITGKDSNFIVKK